MGRRDINARVRLQRRPDERPQLSDFDIVEEPVPEPGPNEVLVCTRSLSVDPKMAEQVSG
jgi:NADPH-dependent curcumin reductase CurA